MTRPLRVVIADDHTLFRDGLAALIETDHDFEVVAHCPDGSAAIETVTTLKPDIAVLDIEMPGPGALSVVAAIRAGAPSVAVVMLSMHQDSRLVRDLVDAGAAAFLAKTVTREQLIAGLRSVLRSPESVVVTTTRDAAQRPENPLSPRELEVLHLVADARSSRQIGTQLGITEATVKRHLTNIYTKLGAVSRVDCIRKAAEYQVIRIVGPADR